MGVAGANPHDDNDASSVKVPQERLAAFDRLMQAGGSEAIAEAVKERPPKTAA